MSEQNYYGEPWRYITNETEDDHLIVDCNGGSVADCVAGDLLYEEIARIVACVNACAGMANPSSEIARLRADVERLRGDLAAVLEKAKWMRNFSSQPHQIKSWDMVVKSWDMVAGIAFESLGKPSLAELAKITAAMADTADKQG